MNKRIGREDLIIAHDHYYSMDCYQTKVNNNVLVVGTSGSGKTRNIVSPNIQQKLGSYVVSDPKGNLYKRYKAMLEADGYVVKKVDFIHPEESAHYNPFHYIHSEQDILKMATILQGDEVKGQNDAFWNDSAKLMLTALIGYIVEGLRENEKNMNTLQQLLAAMDFPEDSNIRSAVDRIMDDHKDKKGETFAVRQYKKFRTAADRTVKSIVITANARLGTFDTDAIRKMLCEDTVELAKIGQRKTAIFVVVSDTDRSMDTLANLFITQAMNELCRYADEYCDIANNTLPVPVRFILDDFATNVKIEEFPRMIASIRSRGISAMLIIQAESQLQASYGADDKTIIGNCDTYVYLGGNDTKTAYEVASRCNIPMPKVLNMPVGECIICRRGEVPVRAKLFDEELYRNQLIRREGEER